MMDKSSIKNLEQTRESITTILDSLNFITQYGSDGKIDGQSFTEVYLNVTEFNSAGFYKEYSPIVKFIKDNHTKLTSKIVDFTPSTIDTATLKEILSVFLQGERKNIVDLYKNDAKVTKIFTEKIINKIDDKLKKFIVTPSPVKFKYSKVPKYNKDKKVEYSYGTPTNEVAYDTEVLTKIMNAQNKLGDTLNFYKK